MLKIEYIKQYFMLIMLILISAIIALFVYIRFQNDEIAKHKWHVIVLESDISSLKEKIAEKESWLRECKKDKASSTQTSFSSSVENSNLSYDNFLLRSEISELERRLRDCD